MTRTSSLSLPIVAALALVACADDPVTPPPPAPIAITTSALPAGRVAVVYSADLAATGGDPTSYAWALKSGALPSGLSLATTGRLAGTPTAEGAFTFEVQVTDGRDGSATKSLSLTIAAREADPLMITTTTLAAAREGQAYSAALTGTGGSGAGYAWSLASGALPAGLTLAADGTPATTIAGTPTAAGRFDVIVRLTDGAGQTAERAFTITVTALPQPLAIDTVALPSGIIGASYTGALAASGGSAPYQWAVTRGALPPGLTLATDGQLSGTPTSTGSAAFTVRVTDAQATTDEADFTIEIRGVGPTLAIVTASLPAGRAGDPYTVELRGTGGNSAGYGWSIVSGALPAGLTITATGTPTTRITGTPTGPGDFTFTVQVTDSVGQRGRRQLSIRVEPAFVPVHIVSSTIPPATVQQPYSGSITAADGLGVSYAWLVTAGSLPTGLSISMLGTPTAMITGTPRVAGTFTATITVFDTNNDTDTIAVTIDVAGPRVPLSIVTTTLPNGGLGEAYAQTLTATAGSAAGYQWSVVQGSLPPGLALGASGTPSTQLSGTPTARGSFSFTVQVADSNGGLATQAYTMSIGTALFVTTSTLPPARLGVPYSAEIVASGGNGAGFTWSVSNGSLPPGLTLPASGTPSVVLSGTPVAFGAFEFTVEVRDSGSTVGQATYRLVVLGPQRYVAWVGDTAIDGQTHLFGVDMTGATPSAPVPFTAPVATGAVPTSANYTQFSPDNSRIAFRGDFTTDGVQDLYVVDLSGPQPAPPVRVNGPMVTGGAIGSFSWSPDSSWLTYQADADINDVLDQYIVDVSGPVPGTPQKVSGTMVSGGDVGIDDFGWSPDSSRVFYVADQEVDNSFYLYVSTIVAGVASAPARINTPLISANADVNALNVTFSADSNRIFYVADQAAVDVEELWMVDLSGPQPGAPVQINTALPANADVQAADVGLSPDGSWLAYIADQATNDVDQLWLVDLRGATPGAPQLISGTLIAAGDVSMISWAPDSTRIMYLADADLDEVDELFVVGVGGALPTTPMKVNIPLTTGRLVVNNNTNGFLWSPDSRWIGYRADPVLDGVYEMFVAPMTPTGPGMSTRLNPPMPATTIISNFFFSPDSQRVAFRGDALVVDRIDLYVSDLSSGTPTLGRLASPPAHNASAVSTGFFWFGSDRLVFIADLAVDAVMNAYWVDVTQPTLTPLLLHPPVPTGGDVNTLFAQQ